MTRKVWIDTDPGLDDAIALLMAFQHKNFEIIGISVSAGNGPLDAMLANVVRIINLFPGVNIKVYRGADRALLGKNYLPIGFSSYFHGSDGLGDRPNISPETPSKSEVQKLVEAEPACQGIVQAVDLYKGQLELICLGALTNLALATRIDENLPTKLKKLVVMGGNLFCTGNVTPTGEFNFRADPEAAYIVLDSYQVLKENMILVPWETCRAMGLSPQDITTDQLLERTSKDYLPFAELLISKYADSEPINAGEGDLVYNGNRSRYFSICDAFAMACLIDETIITGKEVTKCSVELQGQLTRGTTIIYRGENYSGTFGDYIGRLEKITVVNKIDKEKFKSMLLTAFKF